MQQLFWLPTDFCSKNPTPLTRTPYCVWEPRQLRRRQSCCLSAKPKLLRCSKPSASALLGPAALKFQTLTPLSLRVAETSRQGNIIRLCSIRPLSLVKENQCANRHMTSLNQESFKVAGPNSKAFLTPFMPQLKLRQKPFGPLAHYVRGDEHNTY